MMCDFEQGSHTNTMQLCDSSSICLGNTGERVRIFNTFIHGKEFDLLHVVFYLNQQPSTISKFFFFHCFETSNRWVRT